MSEVSDSAIIPFDIYDDDKNEEATLDLSNGNLDSVPEIQQKMLSILYLQNNNITSLPDAFFPTLPYLAYLDLRDNALIDIPKNIEKHPSLTHLLLQNNSLTSLPDELGTVSLKVLQLNGNPLTYPPKAVINKGTDDVLHFLYSRYIEDIITKSESPRSNFENESCAGSSDEKSSTNLSVRVNTKEDLDEINCIRFPKLKGKCPKFDKSIHMPSFYRSHCHNSKHVKPRVINSLKEQEFKLKATTCREMAIEKKKNVQELIEKILQGRKDVEHLSDWRQKYRHRQQFTNPHYKLDAKRMPYGTSPEYMTFLSRDDIEKDLPDKYRKNLFKRARATRPKNANNVHLAMKIKQLFKNLDAIDLNTNEMTPRTEQTVLLNEIQKISEIKQKLSALSLANFQSVVTE